MQALSGVDQDCRLRIPSPDTCTSSAGTGHFYTTTKNKRTKPEKIEMMKYDPKARTHVIYKEGKLK